MSAMTLLQVRDWLTGKERMHVGFQHWSTSLNEQEVRAFKAAIDAHLTQPAQSVGVTDACIAEWADRHDLNFGGSKTDARAAFEDAQSPTAALTEKADG